MKIATCPWLGYRETLAYSSVERRMWRLKYSQISQINSSLLCLMACYIYSFSAEMLSVTPFWTGPVFSVESTNSGWSGYFFFHVLFGKTFFDWFSWSPLSTGLKPGWNGWKTIYVITSPDWSSRKDFFQKLLSFNQKRLEKCSTEKCQPYQPKSVTVDPNRTRPKKQVRTDNK